MPRFHRALGVIVIDLLFDGHLLLSSGSDGESLQLLTHDAATKDNATGSRGTLRKTPCTLSLQGTCEVPCGFAVWETPVFSCGKAL